MENEEYIETRWNRLKARLDDAINLVWASIIGVGLFIYYKNTLIDALLMEHFPVAQLSMMLLSETIFLIFLWVKATRGELQMLQTYFKNFVPPLPKSSFGLSLGISILLGTLAYLSNTIIYYSLLFAVFKLVELWGLWIIDSELKIGLKRARDEAPINDWRRSKWDVIENYYLQKPQVQLAATVLFFSFISVILGLLNKLLSWHPAATWLLSFAYVILIFNIASSEYIYKKWRHKRDIDLDESYNR